MDHSWKSLERHGEMPPSEQRLGALENQVFRVWLDTPRGQRPPQPSTRWGKPANLTFQGPF